MGIAGLIRGRKDRSAKRIFGAEPFDGGSMCLYGEEIRITCPGKAIRRGIGFVPEDRRTQGVMLKKSVKDNITLPSVKRHARKGFVNMQWEKDSSESYIRKLSIKTPVARQ